MLVLWETLLTFDLEESSWDKQSQKLTTTPKSVIFLLKKKIGSKQKLFQNVCMSAKNKIKNEKKEDRVGEQGTLMRDKKSIEHYNI